MSRFPRLPSHNPLQERADAVYTDSVRCCTIVEHAFRTPSRRVLPDQLNHSKRHPVHIIFYQEGCTLSTEAKLAGLSGNVALYSSALAPSRHSEAPTRHYTPRVDHRVDGFDKPKVTPIAHFRLYFFPDSPGTDTPAPCSVGKCRSSSGSSSM